MSKVQIKCRVCAKQPKFGIIGKTFYLLDSDNILCYRHWYQHGTPEFEFHGEYEDLNAILNPKVKRNQLKPIETIKHIVNKSKK
jgi:hypothetical protein